MNGNILRRRMVKGNDVKFLSWVGRADGTNKTISVSVGINLTSTMTFSYDAHPGYNDWQIIFQAAKGYWTSWSSDKNQLGLFRQNASSDKCDVLYFSKNWAAYDVTNARHLFEFNKGVIIDGNRIMTVTTQNVADGGSIWIDGYRIYGFKLWDNNVLIADLVPALYKGNYGLWDKVRKIFKSGGKNATGE